MSASNPLGINLSFCVKRWITPQLWAPVVRDTLGLDKIQFSFDLVDPMWPSAVVSRHAKDVRNAAADYGIRYSTVPSSVWLITPSTSCFIRTKRYGPTPNIGWSAPMISPPKRAFPQSAVLWAPLPQGRMAPRLTPS